MRKIALASLTGLVGAAVLHILIVLLVPFFAVNDAWSRLAAQAGPDQFISVDAMLGSDGERAVLDPFTRTVACRFVIGTTPVHIRAEGSVPFWSLGVFDRQSNELFSINDRNAASGTVDVALATPAQMIGLRESIPEGLASAVLVEMPVREGYVVLRTVIPDASHERAAAEFLTSAECDPFE